MLEISAILKPLVAALVSLVAGGGPFALVQGSPSVGRDAHGRGEGECHALGAVRD